MSNLIVIFASLIYFQINYLILNLIDENVSKPYMDEIFHVPQAQEYCSGNYNEWNEKITTLPGLYLLSTSVIRLISYVLQQDNICTVYNLRLSNLVLSSLNFIIIYKIYHHLNKKKLTNNTNATLICLASTISISLFPINHFFQYLYYTDTGSTFFILFAYYNQLKENYKLSALFCAIAVLYRQTNAVWVVFFTIQLVLLNIENLVKQKTKSKTTLVKANSETNSINLVSNQRNKKISNLFEFISRTPIEALDKDFELNKFFIKLYREDFWGKKLIYMDLFNIINLNQIRPYLIVVSTFIFFVCVNNGIVVGDRSNHEASIHLCQLFYFWSFSCLFSFSSFLFSYRKIKNLFQFLNNNVKLLILIVLPCILIIVKNFTFEHPFLLADNRHYTFYIWSRVFKRFEFVRYALTPVYLICIYLFYKNLNQTGKTIGWLLAFTLCLFVGLVPQKLIEFRYFIIPYFIYRLNISQLSKKEIFTEFLFNLLINLTTIYLFLNRVFYWENAPNEPQRFMW